MAPANIFHFLQARERGQARTRLRETQVMLLRLHERWCWPDAAPHGSEYVKDIIPLGQDAVCLVAKGGHAAAFAVAPEVPEAATGGPRWLTNLNIFQGERIRMAAHLGGSRAILTVFAIPGAAYRGRLFARVLDVQGVLAGETRTRNCGSLADISVPSGGFIEFDDQNQCVWANDGQHLRCWDACSFEERFALGPWGTQEVPNVRFTRGLAGLLRPARGGAIEVALHDPKDGHLLTLTEVQLKPPDAEFVLLEMINDCVLMKRQSCEVAVVSLKNSSCRVLRGTAAWEPEAFVFLPSRHLILALFSDTLEIWSCASPEFCCRIGAVRHLAHIRDNRFCIDEHLGAALVVRSRTVNPHGGQARRQHPEEEIALLDLLRFGGTRAAVRGACDGASGGIGRVLFSATQGLLLLLGRSGSLTAYTSN